MRRKNCLPVKQAAISSGVKTETMSPTAADKTGGSSFTSFNK
jgi:hypothetical protein